MTQQEIFDIVWTGLKSQGFQRSQDANSAWCAYRNPDGLRCAVGHLIQDDEYNEEMEGCLFDEMFSSIMSDRLLNLRQEHGPFLSALQTIHDTSPDHFNMEEGLRNFARRHQLTVGA